MPPWGGCPEEGVTVDIWNIIMVLALGLVVGALGRMLTPNDAFNKMEGWRSWLVSIGLGLIAALLGYWFFTGLLGIGDTDKFDWGGIIGALVFAVPVVWIASFIFKRVSK
jgi:uncharacterized membrane protein YeaQ/YmgE (transglycosylase-associated protein family)